MTTKVTKTGVGTIDQLSTGSVKHESSPVDNITLDANGRVGIGTSSPSTLLEVSGSSVPAVINSSSNQYVLKMSYANSTSSAYLGTFNNALVLAPSSGTASMTIDSAGRVTMPYQPAFQTSEYGPGSISANTQYVFKTTAVHNVGNYYNSSTGKFTAPVAGMYNFNFVVTPSSATSSPAVWIRLNNGATRYGLCLAYNASYNGVSCSPNIYMNVNDYVEPIIEEWNGGTALAIWSAQFGGFLIG